ncbi:MAG: hypothetical protein ACC642_03745 [Pseudomonadales bacterium]
MLDQVDVGDHEGVLAAVEKDGGVIVRNYLQADVLEQVRAKLGAALELEPWCNNDESIGDEFFGLKTKRLHGLLGYGSEIEACLMHPLALALVYSGRTFHSGGENQTGEMRLGLSAGGFLTQL